MKVLISLIVLAAALWTVMFSPITAPHINFWAMMTCSALILSTSSLLASRGILKGLKWSVENVVLGLLIAVALWCVFWIGDVVSQMLFGFARSEVNSIYSMKSGIPGWLLSALLLFIIGPAEEIFWRGYVQKQLSEKLSANKGWIIATALYTLVHVGSCNFMLVMASLTAGLAWGTLYRFFPKRFPAIILSHAIWDVAVFVWFPI